MAATPASSKRRAISSPVSSDCSAQPSTATLPSRASRPTAMRWGYFFAASLTSAGSRTAAVPMMTRFTPFSSQPSIVFMSRMPPPSCTQRPTVSRMRSTAVTFIGLPANAPSRSTTCRWRKPCVSNACACAAGSRLNTVARAMSPCCRRTARPSLRSMAGKRIIMRPSFRKPSAARLSGIHNNEPSDSRTACGYGFRARAYGAPRNDQPSPSRLPLEKIRDQRKAEPLALLRMELRADRRIARDDRGHRTTIVGVGDEAIPVGRVEMIRVHEIAVQPVGPERDAVEQRVVAALVERIPAHVRDLQIRIAWCNAVDFAGNPPQAFDDFVFAAALGHQLHADADAEEGPTFFAHGLVQRIHHAGHGVEPAAAICEGTDTGQHDAIGRAHRIRIVGHQNRLIVTGLARRAFEGFRRRVQIARAVVDDRNRHDRACGCGNSPTMSDDGAGRSKGDGAAGDDGDDGVVSRPALLTQPSKKRRSASSKSLPATTPRFSKPRRASFQRSRLEASMPTRSASSSATHTPALSSTPSRLSANVMPPTSSTYAMNSSHMR